MARKDEPEPEDVEVIEEVVEDADWQVDTDGTEYFIDGGIRYELAADGYAYPVDDPARPAVDAVSPFSPEAAAGKPDAGTDADADQVEDTAAPTTTMDVAVTERTAPLPGPGGNGDGEVMLQLSGLKSGYGSLPVLHGVDMTIRRGETAVMLGLNGAGKTTTALNICGALKAWDGRIEFDGRDIGSWSITRSVRNGIVMIPEGRRVFPELSVGKNLQIGAWSQRKDDEWLELGRERVFTYFPRLRERVDQLAGTLSGGEQQMLAIARGLMSNPRLLVIDEASMGLAPVIVKDVFEIVAQINNDGTTVLMIEQNIGALEVADSAYVMEQGRMVKELHGDQVHDTDEVSSVLMG